MIFLQTHVGWSVVNVAKNKESRVFGSTNMGLIENKVNCKKWGKRTFYI